MQDFTDSVVSSIRPACTAHPVCAICKLLVGTRTGNPGDLDEVCHKLEHVHDIHVNWEIRVIVTKRLSHLHANLANTEQAQDTHTEDHREHPVGRSDNPSCVR